MLSRFFFLLFLAMNSQWLQVAKIRKKCIYSIQNKSADLQHFRFQCNLKLIKLLQVYINMISQIYEILNLIFGGIWLFGLTVRHHAFSHSQPLFSSNVIFCGWFLRTNEAYNPNASTRYATDCGLHFINRKTFICIMTSA